MDNSDGWSGMKRRSSYHGLGRPKVQPVSPTSTYLFRFFGNIALLRYRSPTLNIDLMTMLYLEPGSRSSSACGLVESIAYLTYRHL